jgi:tRNA A-37 threonylcarbamoyl transferase component Bud32/tetratricopeptide (TPR) repeat protein
VTTAVESPCPDENQLVAFVERTLPEEERQAIETHVDTCPRCFVVTCELARVGDDSPISSTMADPGDRNPAPSVPPPARIGRYRLVRFLGQGGMGSVYVAHDSQLDRRVALKLLRSKRLGMNDARARLLREARAMAKLAHPNVVTLFDAGESEGHTFIAMEFIEGVTLATWLREHEPTWREALDLLLCAGRGLAAAHAAGIVHRDFKPENVLIDRSGRVAVGDFGLAAVPQSAPVSEQPASHGGAPTWGAAMTRTGAVLGTPRYMSPEQFDGPNVDARTDQFSFAVTLYEALYAARPFAGDTLAELQAAARENRVREPPPDSQVPAALRRALLKGLSGNPDDRYPTLDAMLAALESAAGADAPKAPASPAPAARRRAWLVPVAIVGTVASLATLALVARHGESTGVRPQATTVSSAAFPLAPGARTDVLIVGIENRTGETLLDGTLDAVVDATLYPSTRIQSYAGSHLKQWAAELGPEVSFSDPRFPAQLAKTKSTPIVVVKGNATRTESAWKVTLEATNALSSDVILHSEELAKDAREVVPALVTLSDRLRAALGDTPSGGVDDRATLSSSLEAVHEWALGRELRSEADATKALEHGTRAVTIDPEFALGHADRGRELYFLNQTPEAVQEYDLALQSPGGLSGHERLVVMGDRNAALDRYVESIAAYEQANSRWPGDERIELSVARQALYARDWPLGTELARRAVTDHPRSSSLRQMLLSAYINSEHIDLAAREGEKAMSDLARPTPDLLVDIAVAETLIGEPKRAGAPLGKLAVLDPEYADEARADLALYEGRLDDAAALLQHWIDDAVSKHDPGAARTEYITVAELLLRRGDRASAAVAAKAALAGSEGEAAIWNQYEIAHSLLESGQEADALTLTRSWKDHPSLVWKAYAKIVSGDLMRAHSKLREATSLYEEALGLVDMWIAHARLGEVYLARGDWAGAERELSLCIARRGEGALVSTPGLHALSPALYALARAKEGRKSPDAAAAYDALLTLEPEPQHDPLAADARRRRDALRVAPTDNGPRTP